MYTSWLNREMDFRTRTIISMITGIVTGISSILMALAGMGVWSLVYSGLLGGVVRNLMLARVTPLRLRPNFDLSVMRRHGAYGSKIVANDMLGHLRREGLKLVLSKLAGPAFIGLYNKADSLHRLPYWTLGQPVAQPLFRAMAKVQDNLDKTKYMYYRAVSLLMVYVLPFFIGLIWVAEPFVNVVYGPKWEAAGRPLAIMAYAGIFYIIARPCGAVLMAQNRLGQQMAAQFAVLIVTLAACVAGLEWGLEGASWGWVFSQVFAAVVLYWLVYRLLPTRLGDLLQAMAPGLLLNGLLLTTLAVTDKISGNLLTTSPLIYMLLMAGTGSLVYATSFLFLPIPALASESQRWSRTLSNGVDRLLKRTA
jgi:O-antigen/teichoic acid export membrane protein